MVDIGQEELPVTIELPVRNQTSPWDPTLVSCHVENSAGQKTQVKAAQPGLERSEARDVRICCFL